MWKKVQEQLKWIPCFGVSEVAQILGIENEVAGAMLVRWLKAGKIWRLKRGIYMSEEYYLSHHNQFGFTETLAMIIQPMAYLSKEYVLQKHAVMTEAVYVVTAVTRKNQLKVINKLGAFNYSHIQDKLFGGYVESDVLGIRICEATPGKALFDYLYFRSNGWTFARRDYDLAEDLRLNLWDWDKSQRDDFANWVEKSKSRKMRDALENLRRNIWS